MRMDMCMGMCMATCIDMCIGMCIDMCIGMCIGIGVEMSTDTCIYMSICAICKHVCVAHASSAHARVRKLEFAHRQAAKRYKPSSLYTCLYTCLYV